LPIFASYGSCAYKNSSAKFKQNILTFPFEIIVWPQKTVKMVSFGNIWRFFRNTEVIPGKNVVLCNVLYVFLCNSGQFPFFHVLLNEKHSIYSQNIPFLQFFVVHTLISNGNVRIITRSNQNIPHLLTSDMDVSHKHWWP
jgi:hypothetical protein